jgi:hypothetical protein
VGTVGPDRNDLLTERLPDLLTRSEQARAAPREFREACDALADGRDELYARAREAASTAEGALAELEKRLWQLRMAQRDRPLGRRP